LATRVRPTRRKSTCCAIQDEETPRGSVERRHSHIVKKDVYDQCGFQTIDVFVGHWMPDATAIERKLHDQEYRTCGGCARAGGTAPCFCGATAAASEKAARDKCGFQTIDVFVGQWMPDATAIERKLHRKFLSRPRNTKHPLGAPRCCRVAGAGFNFERGAHMLRWHRVFFTYSRTMPAMLAAGRVKVNP
jgi:hypothetical protein